MESEARLVMIDGGLPPPVLQYEVVDLDRPQLWRLDFAWPECRVAAEYDGIDWHSGPEAFLSRPPTGSAALQDLGWVVVPIIAEDVRYRPGRARRADRAAPAASGVSVPQNAGGAAACRAYKHARSRREKGYALGPGPMLRAGRVRRSWT